MPKKYQRNQKPLTIRNYLSIGKISVAVLLSGTRKIHVQKPKSYTDLKVSNLPNDDMECSFLL